MNHVRLLLTVFLGVLLASLPSLAAEAAPPNALPVAISPYSLGDDQFELEKRIGQKSEFCFGCSGYSNVLVSTGARLRWKDDESLIVTGAASRDSSFDLFFSGGRLVMIRFKGAYADDAFTIQKFVNTYGEPTSRREWQNGLSWATWIGKAQVLQVGFLNKKHRLYPGIEKGSVVEVSLAAETVADEVLQTFR